MLAQLTHKENGKMISAHCLVFLRAQTIEREEGSQVMTRMRDLGYLLMWGE